MKINVFGDLPKGFRQRVKTIHPNDYELWVNTVIPALNNCSIIESINKDDGISIMATHTKEDIGQLIDCIHELWSNTSLLDHFHPSNISHL